MFIERVKALVIRTEDAGASIIGIYTDDEDGNKILERVRRNMERKHPNLTLKDYTFMLNIPNQ